MLCGNHTRCNTGLIVAKGVPAGNVRQRVYQLGMCVLCGNHMQCNFIEVVGGVGTQVH